MAMKLNTIEKSNDSIIRAYNKQIEQSVRKLGINHTVTQNLINNAYSVFGSNNVKEMKITMGYSGGQIDYTTGEIFGIPQIKRGRSQISDTLKAKALKASYQYMYGDAKGKIKSPYDVTKAYQRAIKQAALDIQKKSITAKDITTKAPKLKDVAKKSFQQVTPKKINERLVYNDLASEIFEAYEEAKKDGAKLDSYQDFAKIHHHGDRTTIDKELLDRISESRREEMIEKSMRGEYVDPNSYLDFSGFIDILGLDEYV